MQKRQKAVQFLCFFAADPNAGDDSILGCAMMDGTGEGQR